MPSLPEESPSEFHLAIVLSSLQDTSWLSGVHDTDVVISESIAKEEEGGEREGGNQ